MYFVSCFSLAILTPELRLHPAYGMRLLQFTDLHGVARETKHMERSIQKFSREQGIICLGRPSKQVMFNKTVPNESIPSVQGHCTLQPKWHNDRESPERLNRQSG